MLASAVPVVDRVAALRELLLGLGRVGIAVSGGVDSLTLAAFAWSLRAALDVTLFHASSAAVPFEASARTRALAAERGWELVVVDAGELADPRYAANPVNRCYFCKSHLFDAVAAVFSGAICTGANLDDLDDVRPGRLAAAERRVHEPFVAAGLSKGAVRALARSLGLNDVAELPASPCLSSRVETGIAIDASLLRLVDDVERAVRVLGIAVVRCRVRASGLVIEHEGHVDEDAVVGLVSPLVGGRAISFAPYRQGSAFLRVIS
ncbi:MAG: adenine nucleotide alpha hydrolase [Deltaproteobacteria bacterium]|nr:adenine nucleotide alpha hydrolase [Deltaproteobacteria bacterium]